MKKPRENEDTITNTRKSDRSSFMELGFTRGKNKEIVS